MHDADHSNASAKQPVRHGSNPFRILRLHTGMEQIRGAYTRKTLPGPRTLLPGPMAAFHQSDKIQNRSRNETAKVLNQ